MSRICTFSSVPRSVSPLYQGIESDFFTTLSPFFAEMGMKLTWAICGVFARIF